jgi:hypothetical protein
MLSFDPTNWRATTQREEPVASARFLAAQFDES